MSWKYLIAMTLVIANGPVWSAPIDAQSINEARWNDKKLFPGGLSPFVVKLQVLLDRAHFSPGEIDGKLGENVDKAAAVYAATHNSSSGMSAEIWEKLSETFNGPIIIEHKLSEAEIKGPFAEKLPLKMEDMKDLPALSYVDVKEKLAEQFHMSPELIVALNPDQKFDKAGDTILVTNVTSGDLAEKVAHIEVDKSRQTLKVFGKSGSMLAMYVATAGSTDKPAPNGVLKVTSVARNPTYRYNPDYAFKGVRAQKPFTIKPGPNNPVGLAWIGLSKEGYGIHGTPEPSKVSKSESHGCIRLTNWDALQLAAATTKGVVVEFKGDEKDRSAVRAQAKKPKSRRHTRR